MHKALNPESIGVDDYNFEEMCPRCWNTIPIVIDNNDHKSYSVKCPVCGEKFMLCTLCRWDQDVANPVCDWATDEGCFRDA